MLIASQLRILEDLLSNSSKGALPHALPSLLFQAWIRGTFLQSRAVISSAWSQKMLQRTDFCPLRRPCLYVALSACAPQRQPKASPQIPAKAWPLASRIYIFLRLTFLFYFFCVFSFLLLLFYLWG